MKTTIIKFRCTSEEKARIAGRARKANVTLSEYCRGQALRGRIEAIPRLTPDEQEYFRELKLHNNNWVHLTNYLRYADAELCHAV